MKKLSKNSGKLSLLLVSAILVLCAGFFIIGCGNDPQRKTENANKGTYALDFSDCPGDSCYVDARGHIPDILNGQHFTMEAWVKRMTNPSDLSAGIFSYMRATGATLFVKNNVPKFGIRRIPAAGDEDQADKTAFSECVAIGETTTECIVQAVGSSSQQETTTTVPATLVLSQTTETDVNVPSATIVATNPPSTSFEIDITSNPSSTITIASPADFITVTAQLTSSPFATSTFTFNVDATVSQSTADFVELANEVWTHIAGVLTSEDQSNGPNRCAAVGAEQPHLAIYINGELNNCATSGEAFAEDPGEDGEGERPFFIGLIGDTPLAFDELNDDGGVSGLLSAAVDEVRFWTTARSASEIQACMNTELGIGGMCGRDNPNLYGYWRLNEGEGATATDLSGSGYTGSIFYTPPVDSELEDAWVSGVPGLKRAD